MVQVNKIGEFIEFIEKEGNHKTINLIKLNNIFQIEVDTEEVQIQVQHEYGKTYETYYLDFEDNEELFKCYTKIKEVLK